MGPTSLRAQSKPNPQISSGAFQLLQSMTWAGMWPRTSTSVRAQLVDPTACPTEPERKRESNRKTEGGEIPPSLTTKKKKNRSENIESVGKYAAQ